MTLVYYPVLVCISRDLVGMVADGAEIVCVVMLKWAWLQIFALALRVLAHLSRIHFLQGWQLCSYPGGGGVRA